MFLRWDVARMIPILLRAEDVIEGYSAEIVETDRGGEATYHGPGQLVAYPIISVRELKLGPVAYVRLLEETTIQMLAEYGVRGHRVVGKSGVWIGGEPGEQAKGRGESDGAQDRSDWCADQRRGCDARHSVECEHRS